MSTFEILVLVHLWPLLWQPDVFVPIYCGFHGAIIGITTSLLTRRSVFDANI